MNTYFVFLWGHAATYTKQEPQPLIFLIKCFLDYVRAVNKLHNAVRGCVGWSKVSDINTVVDS